MSAPPPPNDECTTLDGDASFSECISYTNNPLTPLCAVYKCTQTVDGKKCLAVPRPATYACRPVADPVNDVCDIPGEARHLGVCFWCMPASPVHPD